jgi:PAS domain S-box-containing protein
VPEEGVSTDPLVQSSLVGEAMEDGPALVFVADHDMRYVAVNRFACEALGYTRDELMGLSVTDVAVETRAADMYDDLLRTSQNRGTTALRHKDGRLLRFDYRASETRLAGLTLYVAVGFLEESAAS